MDTAPKQLRLWLVFFGDGHLAPWWAWALRPGFRHVCAASWFADQERWVFVNPCRTGTVIEVMRSDEFGPRFSQLMTDSAAVLRVPARAARRATPRSFHCVGAMKALLGIRSRALLPHGLYVDLRRNHGAEIVDGQHAEAAGRGPGSEAPA
jgi:hypothetical protein